MHPLFEKLTQNFVFSGNIREDAHTFLLHHDCPQIADHVLRVGREAWRLAERFGTDPVHAEIAGYLHDISGVFPNAERVEVAQVLGLDVLPEEEAFPLIVHQKISKVMARELFGVTDVKTLDAIECHTTLKANATVEDLVLFVADKIEWDQQGTPPYLQAITSQLELSLTHAALAYLEYMWSNRHNLRVIHPWLEAAYHELSGTTSSTASIQNL
jgi:predicted HD superfamily hydrolase involved in NAD metabolism